MMAAGHDDAPNKPSEAIAVGLYSVCAFVTPGILPLVVAQLLADGRATISQSGYIAASEYAAMGIATLLAPRFATLTGLRQKALIASAASIAGNLICLYLSGNWIIFARLLSGAGAGILAWLQYAYLARARHGERLSGIYLAAYVMAGAAIFLLMPIFFLPTYGVNALFVAIAVTALLAAIGSYHGPSTLADDKKRPNTAPLSTQGLGLQPLALLASVFFMTAFTTGVWVYLDPIARLNGISPRVTGIAAVICLITQAAGALFGGFAAGKFPNRTMLCTLGFLAIMQGLYILFTHVSPFGLIVFTALLGFVGCAVYPIQLALLVEADPSRKAAEYFSVPYVFGGGFAPFMVASIASENEISTGLVLALSWSIMNIIALSIMLKKKKIADPDVRRRTV